MTTIRILPDILSNQIAAGEVVERPASVVKELVENSLDGDATRIMVEVENGGRSLIRVSDNGSGMSYDDALLALERHATSKIFRQEDLFSIHTLGFRGEALPSIASVSRLTLATREAASDSGVEIRLDGGRIRNVTEAGLPVGTMITVGRLFYNTPARRKFMKTVNTEMGHVTDTLCRIAMGRPSVQFRLSHNGRTVRTLLAVGDPLVRVTDILGKELRNDLHPVEGIDPAVTVRGWVSSHGVCRSSSRGIYIFVNGRFVRDRAVQHALFKGYGGRLMKGQFPVAALFLTLAPDQVDVNVHPTKHEVRFARAKDVFDCIFGQVRKALEQAERSAWVPGRPARPEPVVEPIPDRPHPLPVRDDSVYPELGANDVSRVSETRNVQRPLPPEPHPVRDQKPLWNPRKFADLTVIGQFHRSYILCESGSDLMLIDQHAAHERVVFEQLKHRSDTVPVSVQPLLIPETLDLGHVEADMLARMLPDLARHGIEIEPFGGATFVVKAVPSLLSGKAVGPLVREMVDRAVELGFSPGTEKALDQCLILMACHGAIRAHQALTREQMQELLQQLDRCENPGFCPHGRPTWKRWSLQELEKLFRRIV